MRYLKGSFFSLLVLLTLSACNDGSTNGDPVDNKPNDSTVFHTLMSLKVGNTWNYKVTEYNSDSAQNGNPYSYQMKLLRDSLIGGAKTYLCGSEDGEVRTGFANKADGLYVWSADDGNTYLNLFVKYPVVKGETYHITVNPDHDNSGRTVLVEDTSVNVTVPAGTFKCVKIKMTYDISGVWEVYYFAENIGLIKTEFIDLDEGGSKFYLWGKHELINKNF